MKSKILFYENGGGPNIISKPQRSSKGWSVFNISFRTFIILFLISTILMSCNKDDVSNAGTGNKLENRSIYALSLYQDEDFRDLARVLSIGVKENLSLRTLLKTEALLKFDGDFDILLNKVKNEVILIPSGQQTLTEYLGSIYSRLNLSPKFIGGDGSGSSVSSIINVPTTVTYTITNPTGIPQISNPTDIIPYLISVYPDIQISIPVHAVNWDVNTYTPICTYVPEDYNESTTLTVEGFDNGTSVTVDAVNEPNEPVIVVSNCERIQQVGALVDPPNVTIQLTASQSVSGITLNWTISNPNNDEIVGYRIYKKSLFGNQFVAIFDNMDKDNKNYNDNAVDALQNYFYYVKAYNAMGESGSSNIATITAPSVPNPAETFTANHYIQDEIELRWTYPQGQYIQNSKLYKRVIGVNSEYVLVGTFPSTIYGFIDPNVDKGKRVNYKLELINNQGNSNPKYDFINVPFRNVGVETPLILHKISYDSDKKHEIEGWIRGEPEFKISIAKAGQTGDAAIVQSALKFEMDGTSLITNRLLSNWQPSDWAEILSFSVIEYDKGPKIDLNLDAGFNFKDTSKTMFLNGSSKVTFEDITNSADEDCGKREHKYHNPTSPILEFPLGGVKLYLTN